MFYLISPKLFAKITVIKKENHMSNDYQIPDYLQSPEQISIEQIQHIGKTYLHKHGKSKRGCCSRFFDSLFHSNHKVAEKLKSFKGEIDAYANWYFLANLYAELARSNGELSDAILKYFSAAFGPLPLSMTLVHQTNNINARKFSPLNPYQTSEALKIQIDNYYLRSHLVQLQGNQTAVTNNNTIMQPDSLTNATIQALGTQYLEKFPVHTGYFSCIQNRLHSNHEVAREMQSYDQPVSPFSKWLFLANCYAKLKNSYGVLSDSILTLFSRAFKKAVYTSEDLSQVNSKYHSTLYYAPGTVAESLESIVKQHYNLKAREIYCKQQSELKSQTSTHTLHLNPKKI